VLATATAVRGVVVAAFFLTRHLGSSWLVTVLGLRDIRILLLLLVAPGQRVTTLHVITRLTVVGCALAGGLGAGIYAVGRKTLGAILALAARREFV
jgi:hypothetical protein